MARRKKKLNRKLIIILGSLIGLFVLGVSLVLAYKYMPRDASRYYRRAQTAVSENDRRQAWGLYRTAVYHSRGDIETNQQYRMEFSAFLFDWLESDTSLSQDMRRSIQAEWLTQLEAVLEDEPRNIEARKALTEFYWEGGVRVGSRDATIWDRFLKSAEAQIPLMPADPELLHRIAMAHASLSRTKREHIPIAMECFALATAAAPANASYYLDWVGFLLRQEGIRSRPDLLAPEGGISIDMMNRRIAELVEARRDKQSTPRRVTSVLEGLSPRDVYELGLAANPNSVRIHMALAEYLYFAQKQSVAEDLFNRALAIEPKDAQDLLAIAVYCVQSAGSIDSERGAQALEYYAMARQTDPALLEAVIGQIQLHLARHEYAEAEQICREALTALDTRRAGREIADMKPAEANNAVTGLIHLNITLAQALLGVVPDDPDEREKMLAETRQCIERTVEYLPPIEEEVRQGTMGNVQRQATKVRARLALLAKEEFEAEKLYRLVYDNSPTIDTEATTALVNLYLRQGQETEALRMLQRVTEVAPTESNAWMLTAKIFLAQRNVSRLNEVIQKLQTLDLTEAQVAVLNELEAKAGALAMQMESGTAPADMPEEVQEAEAPMWLAYAQRLLDEEESQEAMKVIQRLQQQFPANELVVAAAVKMHLANDSLDNALKTLDRALSVNPDSKRLAFLKLVVSAPPEQRDQVYLEYVTEHEEGVQRELSLAIFHRQRGDNAKYYEHMERAVAIDPRDQNCLMRLFAAYLTDDKLAEAAKLVEIAKKMDLEGTEGKVFEAQILIAKAKWDEAIVLLSEVAAMRPRFALAHALLGEAYLNTGQLAEAEANFEISYNLNNRDVRTLLGLARIADQLGRTEDHRKWINAAYPHAPGVPYIRNHWLGYRKEQVDPEQFLRDCASLYRRYPRDMDVVLALASAYERLERPNFEKAEEIYRKSYEYVKDGDQGVRHLAQLVMFLQRTGKAAEAQTVLAESAGTVKDALGHALLEVQFLMAEKRFDEARPRLDALCESNPDNTRPFQFLAQWAIDSSKDWPAGVRAMETLIRLSPGNPVLRQHYFEMLMRAGEYDRAIDELSANIERNPEDDEAMALLAHAYQIMGRIPESIAMCDRAITANPMQIRARALRSDMRFAAGDFEESIRDLEEAYKNRPTEAIALLLANRLYEVYPDGTRAKAVLVEALGGSKDSILLLRRIAEIHLATRDWRELEAILARGMITAPRDVTWSLLEAEQWKVRGYPDRRAAALKTAYDIDPRSLPVTIDYIDSLLEIEQYGQVLSVVARVRTESTEAMALLQAAAGRANVKMGDTDQGLSDLQTSLASGRQIGTISKVAEHFYAAVGDQQGMELLNRWLVTNTLPGPRMVLAKKLIELKQMDQAAQALSGADLTEASPDQKLWTLRTLGELQYRLGRFQEARQRYEEALKMAVDASLLNNLAYMLVEDLNDPQAALPYAEQASQLEPTDPNLADTLGWIYFRAGRVDDAKTQLARSLALGQTAAALYHMGLVCESTGQQDKAVEMYRRGFDLVKDNPDDPFYELLRKRVP